MALVRVFRGHDIAISGTLLDPLFPVTTIAKILDDHNIKRYLSSVRLGVEYTSVDGANYLTEAGLYKYLMRSRNHRAEEFQDYVCEIMRGLRIDGRVELQNRADDALLRAKLAESRTSELNQKLHNAARALGVSRERSRLLEANRHLPYQWRADSDERDFAYHYIEMFIYDYKFRWSDNHGRRRLPETFTYESISPRIISEIVQSSAELFMHKNDSGMAELVNSKLSRYLIG